MKITLFQKLIKKKKKKDNNEFQKFLKELYEIKEEIKELKEKINQVEQLSIMNSIKIESNENWKKSIEQKLYVLEYLIKEKENNIRFNKEPLSEFEEKIYNYIKNKKEVRVKDIQEEFKLPKSTASTVLKSLHLKGYIKKVGHGKYRIEKEIR